MKKKVLVTGATGAQGMPVVRELLQKGFEVRAFALEGDPKISALKELGSEVVCGNLFDEESLYKAMEGIYGVFFLPAIPSGNDPSNEITIGKNVISAAERAGVAYMVHSSVDRAGEEETFNTWTDDYGNKGYWIGKSTVIDLIKKSNIPHWTILKPVYMMECFIPPKVFGMYPQLKDGLIVTARLPETRLTMMNCDDLGKMVAQAFVDFEPFEHKEIPLAGDSVTMTEAAAAISKATGKKVESKYMTREELMADESLEAQLQELFKGANLKGSILSSVIDAHEWDNVDGYTADIKYSNSFGVKMSTFEEWCMRHKDEFEIE